MSDKEYDTHDPQGQSATELPSPEWQKEVNDIVFAHVFSLLISDFCVAFSRDGSPSDLSTSPSPTRVSSSPDVHQPTISSSINPPVRQSTRSKSRPTWWDDYQGPLHSKSVMSTVQHTK
ncbi:hypothetical protein AgCh_006389 [Apium graveolens]